MPTADLLRVLLEHYYGDPFDAPTKNMVEGVVQLAMTDLRVLCDEWDIRHHQVDKNAYLDYARSVVEQRHAVQV